MFTLIFNTRFFVSNLVIRQVWCLSGLLDSMEMKGLFSSLMSTTDKLAVKTWTEKTQSAFIVFVHPVCLCICWAELDITLNCVVTSPLARNNSIYFSIEEVGLRQSGWSWNRQDRMLDEFPFIINVFSFERIGLGEETNEQNDSRCSFIRTSVSCIVCLKWLRCMPLRKNLQLFYFGNRERKSCVVVLVLRLVGSGMWLGCIYAAVQDMKIIESALLQECCFTTGHSGGYHSVAVRHRAYRRRPKTANTTEAVVPVSSGLDHFHEGFSTSRPNSLLNLCAGLCSVLT